MTHESGHIPDKTSKPSPPLRLHTFAERQDDVPTPIEKLFFGHLSPELRRQRLKHVETMLESPEFQSRLQVIAQIQAHIEARDTLPAHLAGQLADLHSQITGSPENGGLGYRDDELAAADYWAKRGSDYPLAA
jgi:hypothetical protein